MLTREVIRVNLHTSKANNQTGKRAMKKTDIDTIEKFIAQAVMHLPILRQVRGVDVSNFFVTFHLSDSRINSSDIISLAKCSKMNVEIMAGSRLGVKFAIGLCVNGWDTETHKDLTANCLARYGYSVSILAN